MKAFYFLSLTIILLLTSKSFSQGLPELKVDKNDGNSYNFLLNNIQKISFVNNDSLRISLINMNNFDVKLEDIDKGTFENILSNTLQKLEGIKISHSNSDILINWAEIPSATNYRIYRNTTPDFTSATNIGNLIPNGSQPSFTDVGILQSNLNYYYFVTWEN
ncbi:MAG: hypothetical protein DWQ06_00265 [Calditrichaeota bacterium]|nr:MAG: hypothetical protein DWQ06_00265 [Calditrichota bacterium]